MHHIEYQVVRRGEKFYVRSFHHGHNVMLDTIPYNSLEEAKRILAAEKKHDLEMFQKKDEEIVYREPGM